MPSHTIHYKKRASGGQINGTATTHFLTKEGALVSIITEHYPDEETIDRIFGED